MPLNLLVIRRTAIIANTDPNTNSKAIYAYQTKYIHWQECLLLIGLQILPPSQRRERRM